MNWRLVTLTLLDMKTHFDLNNFNADQNETIVTKKKLAVPRSHSVLISLYMIIQFTGMFLSQHGFALLQSVVCRRMLKTRFILKITFNTHDQIMHHKKCKIL
jgi:hypothetical protein